MAEALGYDVLDAGDVAYDPELGYERAVQTPARGPRRHRHVTYGRARGPGLSWGDSAPTAAYKWMGRECLRAAMRSGTCGGWNVRAGWPARLSWVGVTGILSPLRTAYEY